MKQVIQRISFTLLMSAAILPASLLAQSDKNKDSKDAEQIIITLKGDTKETLVLELKGDKLTVNGKDVKDLDGDVSVQRNKIKDVKSLAITRGGGNRYSYNYNNDNFNSLAFDDNRAMLGVTSEKVDNGAEVREVTTGSAAEKIGLKKGDVITKIDDKKIDSPDDLSAAVRKHKAGEKVTVTYLRDKKEQKGVAELTKWKGVTVYGNSPENFQFDLGDLGDLSKITPRINNNFGQNWSWSGGNGQKLGLSVQDSEDGKGVKVINLDDEGSAAKSGLKEDDVITEIDGKAVNSADEVAKIVRESREKISINVKLLRDGKAQSLDVKIPRKLKTANL
ncbi:PDZ domain-containing protein [Terrimonas sp. NA20]|uniref:PDZ domain-containing protein n=1 Tax=Terrimonas ginsenosidimutans TaxID=2908004 RepID=A0ABS9KQ60_9BACT|nr:PDZ domain-containing protein [Terrimonas ginsenosidimutans]MCG2614458.1 PDZ domain-containing protein [Terrimonas ginsenosidimutans]